MSVDYHLSRLEATLGTPAFDAAFAALKADRSMKAPDVAAVASAFVALTATSAPKNQSLDRIRRRNDNLLDARQKDAVLSHRG